MQNEPKPKRLHWITILVLLFMTSSLGVWQVRGVPGSVPADGPRTQWDAVYQYVWQHGWPLSYLTVSKYSQWNLTTGIKGFRWAALALDISVCLGLLSFTVVAAEWFVHRRRLQFGMRSLLVLMAVAAGVVALQVQRIVEWAHIVALFGLACFIGVVGWVVVRKVRPKLKKIITIPAGAVEQGAS